MKHTYYRRGVFPLDIGIKIKAARQAKGMTQEELGEILGVQKSAIAKYESGRVVNIKRSTLKKISDVLDIPPFELIFDEGQKEKPTENGGLSESQKALIAFAQTVPEEKAEKVLRLLQAILEAD